MLQYLPESIGQLGELSVLNIDRNRLSVLTNRIGECKSIRVLSLRENVLKEIPASIGDCSNLHVINVSGNQLDWLPDTLLKLDVKAVWLSENQAQPLIKFQHETLVGAGGPKRVLTCFLLPQRAPQYNPNQTQPIADSGPPPNFEKENKIRFGDEPMGDEDEDDKAEATNIPFDRDNQFRVTPNPGTLEERKRANQERAKEIQEQLKKMDSRDNIGTYIKYRGSPIIYSFKTDILIYSLKLILIFLQTYKNIQRKDISRKLAMSTMGMTLKKS